MAAGLVGGAAANAQTLDDARRLYAEGRTAEAIDMFRRVAETAGDDLETAGSARNNACVLLTNTGAFAEALLECEQALALRVSLADTGLLARAHNNMGRVLQHLGRYDEAERQFHAALEFNRANGDALGEVINWSNLGALATQAGRYSQALDAHRRALRQAEAHADAPWSAEQQRLARINEAVVLERLGAYREALDIYDDVLAEDEAKPRWQRAGLLVNRGVVYRNLGDPVRASEAFEAAIPLYEAESDRAGLSNAWLNIGLVRHLNLVRPRAAEAAYREALRLAVESGDRTEEIQDLYYLGRLLLDTGNTAEAEALFARCLQQSEEAGSGEGRWASLEGLARIARARGDLRDALEKLRQAIDEVEQVRAGLSGSSLRAGYFGERRPVYALGVDVLAELDRAEPGQGYDRAAFDLVQRAKARVLLDALGTATAPGEPLTAAAVLDTLGDGALLEFFVTERELLVWHAHRGRIALRRLGPPGPTLDTVRSIHADLSRGHDPDPRAVGELSRLLLGDAAAWPDEVTALRVAPDGGLHYLPFELLNHPADPQRSLVEAVTTSYVPSGSALGWLRSARDLPTLTLVGFGDPRGGDEPQEVSTAELWARRFDLGPLPAAAQELDALDRRLPGEHVVRTGEQATEAEFRRVVAGGSRIVHLASHTVIDERLGRGAAILLAPGEDDDGLLHPHEIAALDYPVDLTVLAACRTALGDDADGNALATLTGSFLAAGSGAVVATLWDVNDAATSAFMEQFYYELGRGQPPAAALGRAKRRLQEDPRWRRPALWSAYILVGEAGPVVRASHPSWLPVMLVAMLGGVAIWWAMVAWRRRGGA